MFYNLPVDTSRPGAFCFGRLLIIDSISLIDNDLFNLSILSYVFLPIIS
jgi:hypothetical protein